LKKSKNKPCKDRIRHWEFSMDVQSAEKAGDYADVVLVGNEKELRPAGTRLR
jgi:hypothetical protein